MSHGLSITANSLPTIVMIPASFTPASFYKRTLNKLRDIGFEAVVHALPSASRLPPQNAATLADDVAFFYGVVKGLIGQGKDVVLVAHSYGGIVASELTRGLTKLERMKFGEKNGLVRLVFIAAVVPTVGESLNDVLGSPANLAYQGEYMRNEPYEDCARSQFPDVPLEEGVEWVKQMTMHSVVSFANKLTFPGYKYLPVSWLLCEDDLILNTEFQQKTIAMIEKESGNKVSVYRLRAGHFPSVSIPEETANAISEVIRTDLSGSQS